MTEPRPIASPNRPNHGRAITSPQERAQQLPQLRLRHRSRTSSKRCDPTLPSSRSASSPRWRGTRPRGARAQQSATLATVELAISFIDGESGDMMTVRWAGQGIDQGDKAFYKSLHRRLRYALIKTFMISTGEEPEQEPAPLPVDTSWQVANRSCAASSLVPVAGRELSAKVMDVIKREEGVESGKDLSADQMSRYIEVVTPAVGQEPWH